MTVCDGLCRQHRVQRDQLGDGLVPPRLGKHIGDEVAGAGALPGAVGVPSFKECQQQVFLAVEVVHESGKPHVRDPGHLPHRAGLIAARREHLEGSVKNLLTALSRLGVRPPPYL